MQLLIRAYTPNHMNIALSMHTSHTTYILSHKHCICTLLSDTHSYTWLHIALLHSYIHTNAAYEYSYCITHCIYHLHTLNYSYISTHYIQNTHAYFTHCIHIFILHSDTLYTHKLHYLTTLHWSWMYCMYTHHCIAHFIHTHATLI